MLQAMSGDVTPTPYCVRLFRLTSVPRFICPNLATDEFV
jgi:hypothetical protein